MLTNIRARKIQQNKDYQDTTYDSINMPPIKDHSKIADKSGSLSDCIATNIFRNNDDTIEDVMFQ